MTGAHNTPTEPIWRELYPFASQRLTLSDGDLHYVDEPAIGSDAPTMLFVHGNPTWSFHWRRLIADLRGDFRCVAIDHLGCGLSDKPDRAFTLADRIEHLLGLIDALSLDRVTLVAQDWGGAIGLGALLQRQEILERVLLFNTGAFPPWYVPRRIALCKTPFFGRVALQGLNLFSRAALGMALAQTPRLEAKVAAGYLAPYDSWRNRRAVYEFVADIPRSAQHPTWKTLETQGCARYRRATRQVGRLPGKRPRLVGDLPGRG